jgi:uncharacterized membrane protein YgcG
MTVSAIVLLMVFATMACLAALVAFANHRRRASESAPRSTSSADGGYVLWAGDSSGSDCAPGDASAGCDGGGGDGGGGGGGGD